MSYSPSLSNDVLRAVLSGTEKQILALMAEEPDQEWKELLRTKLALREGNPEQDSDSVGLEEKLFDSAAEGTRREWEDFLRVPVERAAFSGRKDLVERLTSAGAPSNRVMIEATRGGQEQFIFDMMLAMPGRFRGQRDELGNTALHVAADLENEKIVRTLLLDRAPTDVINKAGVAPLHLAIRRGHLPVVKALLLAGATAHLRKGPNDYESSDYWEELLIAEDGWGYSPLMLAVSSQENRLAIMRELLRHGAMVDDGQERGNSALFEAAKKNLPDAVDLLLEAGASVENNDRASGDSPLAIAARRLAHDVALSLLKHGADVNAAATFGETALAAAVDEAETPGSARMVKLLLEWGADETASNMLGTMSDAKGDVRLVKELLANAPRERAWQRRGLPVLCRAFPGRCLAEDEPEGNSSQEKAPWVVLGPVVRKRPRLKSPWNFESPVMDATSSVHDSTGGAEVSDGGGGAQQSSKGQEFGRKTARLLVGLKEDGVFRHVVEFL